MNYLSKMSEVDRLNLCDIAWFIKGFRAGKPDCPLGDDHEETLRKLCRVLGEYEQDRTGEEKAP